MELFIGEVIGDIHIIVYEVSNGLKFFTIKSDNENILPIIDIIVDTLAKY